MSQDLWNKLEAEFEKQVPLRAVELPAPPPAERRPTPNRLATRTLNGYLPTMLLTLLALALSAHGQGNWTLFGCSLFLLPILTWLIRPILYSGRRTPAWILLLGPLYVGGLGETTSAVLQGLMAYQSYHELRDFEFLEILDKHLEAFLSFEHFAIYLSAGLALYWLTRKLEKRWYWLDLKPMSGFWRWSLSTLLVFLPSLFIGFALWQHSWTERELLWIQSQENKPAAQLVDNADRLGMDGSWPEMVRLTERFPFPVISESEAKIVQQLEARLLEIWPSFEADPQPRPIDIFRVNEWLYDLGRGSGQLSEGPKIALALLRYKSKFPDYISSSQVDLVREQLSEYIASSPLEHISSLPKSLSLEDSLEASKVSTERLDTFVYRFLTREMGWQLGEPYALKMNEAVRTNPNLQAIVIFGRETRTTPLGIYARWKARPGLKWYMEARENLSKGISSEWYQTLIDRREPGPDEHLFEYYLSRGVVWEMVSVSDELIRMNYLILALRRYQAENGNWPDSLKDFSDSLNLDFYRFECSFDPKSQLFKVYDKVEKCDFGQWRLR